MFEISQRVFGVVQDPRTREYVRWMQEEVGQVTYLAIVDCYKFIGVRRIDRPNGSRMKSKIRGSRTCNFWRENYADSGTEVVLGVPVSQVRYLASALPPQRALNVSGGVERLCYFLLKNAPELFLETCFVLPQKFESQRYI